MANSELFEDNELLSKSMVAASKVEFLANSEELFLYAKALYEATLWGRKIDRERAKKIKRDRISALLSVT
ncbi:hypothetical protein [Bacteroides reticulotermitis]|uniref:Uncharacterized protein n=1 Tax=Bacteroides reticulotermitis TaxID=1133319 RepID=A0A840D613_9BACE|nr:hypothetical protein [Bacteroides reticulotermitis]MBB4043833.1 hypothetical protein [Bacteroides reticulotermitis]